ncbi:MAG: hypothetical protein AB1782_00360 [Cyanobacteriota bacterium]
MILLEAKQMKKNESKLVKLLLKSAKANRLNRIREIKRDVIPNIKVSAV